MKILLYSNGYSESYSGLVNALLQVKGHTVGTVHGQVEESAIEQFGPQLVFYYSPTPVELFNSKKFASIKLDRCEPFLDLNLVQKKELKNYHQSDIVYMGDPKVFGNGLVKFFNTDYKVKIFHDKPVNLFCYCGVIPRDEQTLFYRGSKVCPVLPSETTKIYEIVYSDSNPVLYNGDPLELTLSVDRALKGEKVSIISKEEIVQRHTSFDICASVFKQAGLHKLAEEVLGAKHV